MVVIVVQFYRPTLGTVGQLLVIAQQLNFTLTVLLTGQLLLLVMLLLTAPSICLLVVTRPIGMVH